MRATPPSLSEFGPTIAVPLHVRRIRNARIAWLNERWFLRRGVDVVDPGNRLSVCNWLLTNYAFAVQSPRDPPEAFLPDHKIFFADRYGGAGIGRNGGSGRSAFQGGFQVKGIGASPLVAPDSDVFHSHGCLSLEEGIREVIYSEVAGMEFPYGAAPAVALIATELRLYLTEDSGGQVRVLLVRPCIVRAAHMEPALFFNPEPFSKQHHIEDARRVMSVIQSFVAQGSAAGSAFFQTPSIGGFAERLGAQIAFGHVHRLYHGPYSSSNVGINGELIDFGGFRALPNWEQALVAKGAPCFGRQDWKVLLRRLEELCFYLTKYGSSKIGQRLDPRAVIASATRAYEATFRSECLTLFGLEQAPAEGAERVLSAVYSYFATQQRSTRKYFESATDSAEWLWPALTLAQGAPGNCQNAPLIDDLRHAIQSLDPQFAARCRWAIRRLLVPRPLLYRENLQRWILNAFPPWEMADDTLEDQVLRYISKSRRLWRKVPYGYSVLGHATGTHNVALYCIREDNQQKNLLVEAAVLAGDAVLFGKRISMVELESYVQHLDDTSVLFNFSVEEAYHGEPRTIPLSSSEVLLPAIDVLYGSQESTTNPPPIDLQCSLDMEVLPPRAGDIA